MKVTAVQELLANSILARCDTTPATSPVTGGRCDAPSNEQAYLVEWRDIGTGDKRERLFSSQKEAETFVIKNAKYMRANYTKVIKQGGSRNDAADTTKFEARVYEKAEHWTFDTTVDAKDEAEARKLLTKDYPKSAYTIQEIRAS